MTLEDKDRYSESATETENTSRFKCFRTGISGGFTTKNKGYKLSLSTRRLNDQKLKAFPIVAIGIGKNQQWQNLRQRVIGN